jgi:hypothetical protein
MLTQLCCHRSMMSINGQLVKCKGSVLSHSSNKFSLKHNKLEDDEVKHKRLSGCTPEIEIKCVLSAVIRLHSKCCQIDFVRRNKKPDNDMLAHSGGCGWGHKDDKKRLYSVSNYY